MSNLLAALPLVTGDSRRCPTCLGWTLEFFVSLRRATNPEADEICTTGERAGHHFHTGADCTSCGDYFEVAR